MIRGRVEVAGAELYLEVDGTGPALVLIHDRASTHEVWAETFAALAKDHRVVAFDSRGVGQSPPPPPGADYTVELLADDVVTLLDALALERAVLVGISMGGGVAQMCALRHPERVAGLALISTSPSFSDSTRARMRAEADLIEREGIDRAMTATMCRRWFTDDFAARRPDAVEAVQLGIEAMDPVVLAARSRANAERDFSARLGEIACPVLFVGGAHDPMNPAAHASTYANALRTLDIVMIEGSSHLVPVQAPAELVASLRDFVARRV